MATALVECAAVPAPEPCAFLQGSGQEPGRYGKDTRDIRSEQAQIGARVRVREESGRLFSSPLVTQVPGIVVAMIERIRWNWHHFASSRAGLRFRERYRLHQSRRRRGGFDIVHFSYIIGGTLLIAVSTLLGWLPLLGWGTAILGLSMIAAEFYAVARLMDRLEVRARELLESLGKAFVRLPTWAQLCVSMLITASSITLVYGLYSLSFG